MTSGIRKYEDIDYFLKDLNVPTLKFPEFYIVKFESHDFNAPITKMAYQHNYFEIAFSIGYDSKVSIDEHNRNVMDFNLSFISPKQTVSWELNEIHPQASSYMVLFKPEFLSIGNDVFNLYKKFPFFNRNVTPSFRLTDKQQNLFESYLLHMIEEYKKSRKDKIEFIRHYLSLFLLQAKREFEFDTEHLIMTRKQEITYYFENLIINTKQKYQPTSYYAGKLNVSAIYLAKCVKESTNKTVSAILSEYLILEAKSLLKHTALTISEIAYTIGFSDNSNFNKYFKKHTGTSPKQYREK